MKKEEFDQAVGRILGIKSGEIQYSQVTRILGSADNWRVNLQIKATAKQIAKLKELILQNGQ